MAKNEAQKNKNNSRPIADVEISGRDNKHVLTNMSQRIQADLMKLDPSLRAQVYGGNRIHVYSESLVEIDTRLVERVINGLCERYKDDSSIRGYDVLFIDFQEKRDSTVRESFYSAFERMKQAEKDADDLCLRNMEMEEGLKKKEKVLDASAKTQEEYIATIEENERLKEVVSSLQGSTDKGLKKKLEVAESKVRTLEEALEQSVSNDSIGGNIKRFENRELNRLRGELNNLNGQIEKLKSGGNVYSNVYEASLSVLVDVSKRLPSLLKYLSSVGNDEEIREKLEGLFANISLGKYLGDGDVIDVLTRVSEESGMEEASLRKTLGGIYDRNNPLYEELEKELGTIQQQEALKLTCESFPPSQRQTILDAIGKNIVTVREREKDYSIKKENILIGEIGKLRECFRLVGELKNVEIGENSGNLEEILGGRKDIPVLVRASRDDDRYSIRLVLPIDGDSVDDVFPGPLVDGSESSVRTRQIHNTLLSATLFNGDKKNDSWLFNLGLGGLKQEIVGDVGSRLLSYTFSIPITEEPENVLKKSREIVDSVVLGEAELRLSQHGIGLQTIEIYEHFNSNSDNNQHSVVDIDTNNDYQKLADFLGSGGLRTAKEVHNFLGGMGLNYHYRRKLLENSRKDGLIEMIGESNHARYRLVK